jgi:hypothetical protein
MQRENPSCGHADRDGGIVLSLYATPLFHFGRLAKSRFQSPNALALQS